jgi:hypothetical protein
MASSKVNLAPAREVWRRANAEVVDSYLPTSKE